MVETSIKILFFVIMVATVVCVDFLFLRHLFWERLAVNIGIVVIYLILFLTFINK